jgi:predicted transposase YdaD
MKEIVVYNATVAYAKKEGEQLGFGRGVREGVWQTARKMLAKGYSVADIVGITELSREQIRALKHS